MKKGLIWITLFTLLDQISKIIISNVMSVGNSVELISNFFNITYVHNEGAAFSILMGNRFLFIIIGFIALILIYIFFIKNKELKRYEIILYALLISGILGNMIDRIIYGYVIDFLDFTIFGYPFAIFNIADSYIVISVIFLIIISMWGDYKCKKLSQK